MYCVAVPGTFVLLWILKAQNSWNKISPAERTRAAPLTYVFLDSNILPNIREVPAAVSQGRKREAGVSGIASGIDCLDQGVR